MSDGLRNGSDRGASEPPAGQQLLIGEILRRAARSTPESPAASFGGVVRTYRELARDADRLAWALRERAGIGHGDRVVCWVDTALEVLPLFFAVAQLGAVFAPLNARLGAREAGQVAALVRGTLLITDSERAPAAAEVAAAGGIDRLAVLATGPQPAVESASSTRALVLDAESLPDPTSEIDEPRLRENDAHVIFFTSGSTGRPKGVVLSHRANWLRGFQGVFRDDPERTVCMFPLYHMAGFTLAISAWQTRGEIILCDANAPAILDAVATRRANRIYALPLVWKRVLEEDTSAWDLSTLAQLDTGTSATPIELLRAIKARFPRTQLRIYYGSTECGSATALCDVDVLERPGSVGRASMSVDVRLSDDGEILVRSPFLMDGYFEDPETTAETLVDGWYRSGDLGAFDEDGFLSILGRKKEILRSGGESISPAEVEAVLRDAPGVSEIAIVGLPDPDWGERVCAAVVPERGSIVTLAGLQEYCASRLAGFKKPRSLVLLEALPRTAATAQIQRTLLVEKIISEELVSDE